MWRKVLKSPLQEAEFEGPKNTENLVKHNSSFLIEHFLNSTTIREGFKKKIVEFFTKRGGGRIGRFSTKNRVDTGKID